MRYAAVVAGLAAAVYASPAPVATATGASSSCASSYSGSFEIELLNVTTSKRDLEKRVPLMATLSNGVLKDAEGRIGYIAKNAQFQFDYAAQPGSLYDAGWAVCPNKTLVLGSTAVFQECLSGMFYNLYDGNTAAQCNNIYIQVVSMGGADVSQIGDGQPQATTVVSQITDGQIQGPTNVVTQITDGQIQGPTNVVTQITDGQIQGPVVTQITDGQIQGPVMTSAPVVSQITDGQIQAPTSAAVVTQITDGQIQAPTSAMPVKPSNGSVPHYPTTSAVAYTGAAVLPTAQAFVGLAAGVLAVAML